MNTTKRFWVIMVGIVAVLPLAPLLFGRFPAIGDMRDVFIPLESFFHTQQLQGNIPAWNPAVSFGFPVIASAQIGFFYPVLFLLRFLPIFIELPIALLLHASLCAIGTFFFARRLSLSKEASLLTALSFSLSQGIWQHLTHLNIFLAVAWLPWQMWAVDILFRKEKIERKGIMALIVLFGVPFLIGQIQIPFLIMAVSLLYGLFIRHKKKALKRSVGTVIAIALGTFLLACVQLLPTLELASLSSRGGAGGFDIVRANQHSYPIYHLPTLLFPRFYGNDSTYWGKRLEIEYGSYIGVIPLLLAIWFLYRYIATKPKDATISFFLWLAGISFLLALGSLSPFRFIGIEPSLWIFSAPARWLLFTTLSFSLFAGYGFDLIWKQPMNAKKFLYLIAGVGAILLIITNSTLFLVPTPELPKLQSMLTSAQASSVSFLSPYTYITLLSILILPFALRHKNGKQILLIVSAIDLIIIAYTTTPTIPWKSILAVPVSVEQLPQNIRDHTARIYSLRDGGDTGAYFTDPSSRANAAVRELQKNLLVPMVSSQFGIYGIEWPASLDLSEQGEQLEKLHPTQPYAVEDTELAQELTIGAVLSPAADGSVDIITLPTKPRFEMNNGTVEVVSEQSSEITLKTNSSQNSTLTIRDTFYPGWHVYIDGKEVEIINAPLFFRSIQVPAGEHLVEFFYTPTWLYIGAGISLFSLGALLITWLRKSQK